MEWLALVWMISMIPVMGVGIHLGDKFGKKYDSPFLCWVIMLGLPTVYTFAVFGMLGHFD